jgi:hypothetical protein
MNDATASGGARPANRLRPLIWGGAALLLMVPWVAMRFTAEVNWTLADFVVFGAMLAGACGGYELAAGASGDRTYRMAAGLALAAAFVLVWANLAVGLVGDEDDPVNLLFMAVLLVGIVGAVLGRGRAAGMARALLATAIAQTLATALALVAFDARPIEVVLLMVLFVGPWLVAAHLFRQAARSQGDPS